MNIRRLSAPAWGVVTALAMSGCCGGEQHSVRVAMPDLLTVQVGNNTLLMAANGSLTSPPLSPSALEFLFNTLEGSASGEGIILTLRGTEFNGGEAIMLSLALPVALHNGDAYTVGRTFTNDPNAVSDAGAYGPYDLAQPNQAEVAFTEATNTFPPPSFDVHYRATTTTGTVRVSNRQRGQVELMLDLHFTDASGTTATVTGRVLAINERTKASCS